MVFWGYYNLVAFDMFWERYRLNFWCVVLNIMKIVDIFEREEYLVMICY